MNNVAGDPKYTEIKAELEQQLMAELKRTGDPRVGEGECVFETPPFVGPWKRTPKNFLDDFLRKRQAA